MNTFAAHADRFFASIDSKVAEIMAQGPIYSRNIRRKLIAADVCRQRDLDNCLGDLIKAAMVTEKDCRSEFEAAYYRGCIEVLSEARNEINRRGRLHQARAERDANPAPADAGGPFPIAD